MVTRARTSTSSLASSRATRGQNEIAVNSNRRSRGDPSSGAHPVISFEIEGRPMAPKDHPSAEFFTTGVNYFKTIGIPLIKGRDFDDRAEVYKQAISCCAT